MDARGAQALAVKPSIGNGHEHHRSEEYLGLLANQWLFFLFTQGQDSQNKIVQ